MSLARLFFNKDTVLYFRFNKSLDMTLMISALRFRAVGLSNLDK